jgi:hypothetical protein
MANPTELDSTFASIGRGVEIVLSAPIPFIVLLAILGGIIWRVLAHHYAGQLAAKDAQLALRADRIAEYERKAGATPDEAQSRIQALEDKIARIQRQRRLSEEQKDAIAKAVRGLTLGEYAFDVVFPLPSPEAAIYAEDFNEAFERAGWRRIVGSMMSGHRVTRQGITLYVPDLRKKSSISNAVATGLQNAGIAFVWSDEGDYDRDRLYIDMAEAA